jgi:hypothetical protein
MEADYTTMSAALNICNYLRRRRSMLPVLIYCGQTIADARQLLTTAKLRKTAATDCPVAARKFAKGAIEIEMLQ